MFTITDYRHAQCLDCARERECFVVSCAQQTFVNVPLCAKCLEKQARMRAGKQRTTAGKTPLAMPVS